MRKLLALVAIATAMTAAPKQESPFACNRNALTTEQRRRHFDEIGPALRRSRIGVRELPNGYAFAFPSDGKTFAMLTEWIGEERLCCPFFDITVRIEREGGPVWMELSGRPGTKQFIESEGADWIRR